MNCGRAIWLAQDFRVSDRRTEETEGYKISLGK
jgi:hypothetical protein